MYITSYVKEHGIQEGLAKFFAQKRMPYEVLTLLPDAPADCPWHALRDMTLAEAIAGVFAPLADQFSGTVAQLQEHSRALACVRAAGVWYLLYVVRPYADDILWIGREPADSPPLPEAAQTAGWTLPEPLANFYRIHNGFGVSDVSGGAGFDARLWNAVCIRPAHRLELLAWETEGEDGVAYEPSDMLFFFHDGGGDYEGFLPKEASDDPWEVAYYNHEEDYVEDSLAGDFFETMDEWFEEQFA